MKTIGFVDYYLSEWHANEYPAWIKEANEKLGEDFELKYAWAELDKSLVDGVSTDEWCAKYGVEKCETIEELCQKADYILVLAPSNPETHLKYAEKVLKFKKNTYIDKTFAPDYATAQRIFEIAKENGTKFFSSSALRYSTELCDLVDSKCVITQGGGGNLEEYIIHQVEMAVKTMNAKATKVRVELQGDNQYLCTVAFENGKRATLIYAPCFGFSICAQKQDGGFVNRGIASDFFKALIEDILRFYKSGETSFCGCQTLEVMKIRGGIIQAKNTLGEWVEL